MEGKTIKSNDIINRQVWLIFILTDFGLSLKNNTIIQNLKLFNQQKTAYDFGRRSFRKYICIPEDSEKQLSGKCIRLLLQHKFCEE
jgi:hypothetical protein